MKVLILSSSPRKGGNSDVDHSKDVVMGWLK